MAFLFTDPVSVYSRPIAAFLGTLTVGILIGVSAPDHPAWAGAAAVVGMGGMLVGLMRKRPIRVSPWVWFAAVGYLSIQPWATEKLPDHHISRFITTDSWQISGVLDGPPWMDSLRQKFDISVATLENDHGLFPVSGKLRITFDGGPLDLNAGDTVCFHGRIQPIRNFQNPGAFDYRRFMAYNGIYGTVFITGALIEHKPSSQDGVMSGIYRLRKTISKNLETIADPDDRAVLKALVIGERDTVSDTLTDNFSKAGVSHLLSISGLHVGIVGLTSFWVFRWGFSWIPFFLWRAWTRKAAALLAMIPVLGYGLISGMAPSTQRSVIMILVFLMTFLIHREHEPLNTLSVAAILILIVHPPSLFTVSFQLSFASVFAILYLLPRFWQPDTDHLTLRKRVRNFLLSSFWVTFCATLGVQPLVMYYFNQISLISPLANIVLIPLVGSVATPMGLIFAALSVVSPAASRWGLDMTAAVIHIALKLTDFFANLPDAAIKTVTPSLLELICFYLLLLTLAAFKRKQQTSSQLLKSLSLPHRDVRSPYVQKVMGITAAITILMLGLDGFYWGYQRFGRSDFRVTVLDVGQGSASLLEFPNGPVMLIDAGGFSNSAAFDIGRMVVAPFLWRKKIRTVEYLVLSHADSDHVNGMGYIAENFHVKSVWSNSAPEASAGYRQLIKVMQERGLEFIDFRRFPRHHEISGVTIDIVNPPPDYLERRDVETWRDINNNSLVVHARYQSVGFLFPGDIKSGAEKEMVSHYGKSLHSRFLLAPHHGSKSSNSAAFIETVAPQVVIFSTGVNNRFDFPHPSVIKRYQNIGADWLNTAAHGAVEISTDGNASIITPFTGSSMENYHGNL